MRKRLIQLGMLFCFSIIAVISGCEILQAGVAVPPTEDESARWDTCERNLILAIQQNRQQQQLPLTKQQLNVFLEENLTPCAPYVAAGKVDSWAVDSFRISYLKYAHPGQLFDYEVAHNQHAFAISADTLWTWQLVVDHYPSLRSWRKQRPRGEFVFEGSFSVTTIDTKQ